MHSPCQNIYQEKKFLFHFFEKKTPGAREGTPGAALGKEIEKHPGKYVSLFS
jgi:hypothetical protein